MPDVMTFQPDPEQARALAHARGQLLVTGGPGTGKSVVLRERLARLVEGGADPERVALVVRTSLARRAAREALLARLSRALPTVRVLTVHGLAHAVLAARFSILGYDAPPHVLTALDQFSKVRDLLEGEHPSDWPVYGSMLSLRGFADEARQFLLRAQEALLEPDEVVASAQAAGLRGWEELARFYRTYLDVLGHEGAVDFAGLVVQAAAAGAKGDRLFDHLLVDDYQEATFAEEALLVGLDPETLVVSGDAGSHIFSFQGTTDVPLERFGESFPAAGHVELGTPHRGAGIGAEAWSVPHTSEEHAAVARELRRTHVEEGVSWSDLAVVVRRLGTHMGGLIRALDEAGIPRSVPERGLSILAEPATVPFVLALRWLARPADRDGLVEALLTSDLAGLSPAAARGLVRAAAAAGLPPASALDGTEGLGPEEAASVMALNRVLLGAQSVAGRSVLDVFSTLWIGLSLSRRLVEAADATASGRRDLDAVLALSQAIARSGEGADASTEAFLELLESGEDAPELAGLAQSREEGQAVQVLTAHAAAGLEFDTVAIAGVVEGDFPSLSRPEPMFDLSLLGPPATQADRNRLRLQDERRLFGVVTSRARRRMLFTASDPHGEDSTLAARSRFVAERGIAWKPPPSPPFPDPLSVAEGVAAWRRTLADVGVPPVRRLACLQGILALGDRPDAWWFQRDWTGTDRPLHENIRVSFSRLDKLENCALQYVLAEELGLERRAGYHAWVGHLVHKLVEDCESGMIERTLDALVAEAEARWRPAEFPSFAVSEAFRRSVTRQMIPNWLAAYGATPALERELRFSFPFEGATVSGAIDRVSSAGKVGSQITDYKTGRGKIGSPEDNLQLGIYYLAVSRAEELARFRPVKAVELAFLKEKNREGMVARSQLGMNSIAQAEFAGEMEARLADLIEQIRKLLRTEVYRPNPGANCRYCDFKPLCPLWPEGKPLFTAAEGGS